jgi:RING-box protein 1
VSSASLDRVDVLAPFRTRLCTKLCTKLGTHVLPRLTRRERLEPLAQEIVKADAGTGSKKKEGRFQIKKWNAVAMWSWAICTDTCAICRNNLYEASIDYQANPNGDPEHPGLSIAWGQCGHVFHLDCIQRWLKTRSACPLCQKEWDFTKIEKINPSSN